MKPRVMRSRLKSRYTPEEWIKKWEMDNVKILGGVLQKVIKVCHTHKRSEFWIKYKTLRFELNLYLSESKDEVTYDFECDIYKYKWKKKGLAIFNSLDKIEVHVIIVNLIELYCNKSTLDKVIQAKKPRVLNTKIDRFFIQFNKLY